MKNVLLLSLLGFAFGNFAHLQAEDHKGSPLIVRPESVETFDVPDYLAATYPHQKVVLVTFVPVNHPASPDGSNLLPGEGSFSDRAMGPLEPERIRLLVPEDDPALLVHTLKTSNGAFRLNVYDSGDGYFDTIPLSSPQIDTVGDAKASDADPNTELNSLYQNLLKNHTGDNWFITALRNAQRAWLRYRDARADLEAWAVGKTNPDEAARAQELRILTQARVKDLQHYGINGLPWDFKWVPLSQDYGSPAEPGNPVSDRYNWYRQQIIDRKLANVIAPWIAAQKGWADFIVAEKLFESRSEVTGADGNEISPTHGATDSELLTKADVRLDHKRWAELNTVALELGLVPHQPDSSSPAPDVELDRSTLLSERGDLRVEISYSGNSQTTVVCSNADNSRQQLADPNADHDTSKANDYSSDIYISPDSRWILDIASRTHTNREPKTINAILYQVSKVTPLALETVPGDGPSFGQMALKHFHQPKDWLVYLNFSAWKPDKLDFIYTTRSDTEPYAGDDAVDWKCEYDLKQGVFSEPVRIPGPSHFAQE